MESLALERKMNRTANRTLAKKPIDRETVLPNPKDSSHELGLLCAKAAIDKKGTDVMLLDIRKDSAFADIFVVVSAQNDRQTRAIGEAMEEALRKKGIKARSREGNSEGRWVLIDFGEIVAHIFLEPLREYYRLEDIWTNSPKIQIPAEYYYSSAT